MYSHKGLLLIYEYEHSGVRFFLRDESRIAALRPHRFLQAVRHCLCMMTSVPLLRVV